MATKKRIIAQPWLHSILAVVVIFGSLGAFLYWHATAHVVYIDNSVLDAPIATISPASPGSLNALYVKEGDHVAANTPVALVGAETLFAQENGIIFGAPQALGSYFAPGQKVLAIIANEKMRVVGTLDETKGLSRIQPGEPARFTVDAYPGATYMGTVDEVSPASDDAGVLFSISDKRPVKKFDVYVTFDTSKYPELKSGMSARIWVTTN